MKGGKRRSKKGSSKKGSRKGSRKGMKGGNVDMGEMGMEGFDGTEMVADAVDMQGGKKRRGSKKGSMKRELNPALKATQVINEKILKETGAERGHWFGLIAYVNSLRKEAKKQVKDEKDFKAVNDKIMELFKVDLDKKGKGKIAGMIKDMYTEAMAKRGKRGSKK
jgi:hypothetical protein